MSGLGPLVIFFIGLFCGGVAGFLLGVITEGVNWEDSFKEKDKNDNDTKT